MTNEIITALNDLNGEQLFKFQYGIEDDPLYAKRKVILQAVYTKTGEVILQTVNMINLFTTITPEQGDLFIREFNKQLMQNVLYSIETDGKIFTTTGRRVTTFADIRKQQLKTNDNEHDSTSVQTRRPELPIRRPNNGADDGTEGIQIERLPKPDHIWN